MNMIDEDQLYKLVREKIKDLRTDSSEFKPKLSQAGLGTVLSLTRSSVANIESGSQRVSLANIYAICDHFKLNLVDFLPTLGEVTRDTEQLTADSELGPKTFRALQKLKQGS